MMNIRGLMFDDPQSTDDLKLPTMDFHVPDDHADGRSGSIDGESVNEAASERSCWAMAPETASIISLVIECYVSATILRQCKYLWSAYWHRFTYASWLPVDTIYPGAMFPYFAYYFVSHRIDYACRKLTMGLINRWYLSRSLRAASYRSTTPALQFISQRKFWRCKWFIGSLLYPCFMANLNDCHSLDRLMWRHFIRGWKEDEIRHEPSQL